MLHKRYQPSGFTLIELVITIFLITIFASSILLIIRPEQLRKRSRDVVRLSDIGSLMQAIERFNLETGSLPDLDNMTRQSNVSAGSGLPARADGEGWIGEDLTEHTPALPVDFINSGSFIYRYRHDGIRYELDAQLEYHLELMVTSKDGGDDDNRYEMGTDLTLL